MRQHAARVDGLRNNAGPLRLCPGTTPLSLCLPHSVSGELRLRGPSGPTVPAGNLFAPAQFRKPRKVKIMTAVLYVLLPVVLGLIGVGIPMVGVRVIEQKSR